MDTWVPWCPSDNRASGDRKFKNCIGRACVLSFSGFVQFSLCGLFASLGVGRCQFSVVCAVAGVGHWRSIFNKLLSTYCRFCWLSVHVRCRDFTYGGSFLSNCCVTTQLNTLIIKPMPPLSPNSGPRSESDGRRQARELRSGIRNGNGTWAIYTVHNVNIIHLIHYIR